MSTVPSTPSASPAERVYDRFFEDDGRVCADIPESVCTALPRNFLRNVVALSLTKWGDAIINAKTTLPWLLGSLGAPAWVASVLVPVRESGSMLPQLAIASWVRRKAVRKWVFVLGSVLQGVCVFGLAATAWTLRGAAAGGAVLALVVLFSLSRGLCSVASKDVLGKTVPKRRRGRVGGVAASIAGVGTLVAAISLQWRGEGETAYVALLLAGGLFWFLAAAVYATVEEQEGATEGGVNGLREGLGRLVLLRDDADFRRFVFVRSLLVGTALMAPLLVLLARERADTHLAYFLVAQGVASMVSGHAWGVASDRSSRRVIILAAGLAAGLGATVVAVDRLLPDVARTAWFLPACFFGLAVTHDGVRLGRKTYLVDLGGGNKRTDYVAVSNTILGVVLLGAGAVLASLEAWSMHGAILVLAVSALFSALLAKGLPEAQED